MCSLMSLGEKKRFVAVVSVVVATAAGVAAAMGPVPEGNRNEATSHHGEIGDAQSVSGSRQKELKPKEASEADPSAALSPAQVFQKVDADADGQLILSEVFAHRSRMKMASPLASKLEDAFRMADVDHDEALSLEEFSTPGAVVARIVMRRPVRPSFRREYDIEGATKDFEQQPVSDFVMLVLLAANILFAGWIIWRTLRWRFAKK